MTYGKEGLTRHYAKNSTHTACGEKIEKLTQLATPRYISCFYCRQEWERTTEKR